MQILAGLGLGIVFSLVSTWLGWRDFTIRWVDPFGMVFIRLLKLISIPLVLFSIVCGISQMRDMSSLKRIGAKTLGSYLFTTAFTIVLGLVIVNVIRPGSFLDEGQLQRNRISYELWAGDTPGVEIKDGRSLVTDPANSRMVEEARDVKSDPSRESDGVPLPSTETGPLDFMVNMIPENIFSSLSNNSKMLQIIFFAIFFGIAVAMLPEEQSVHVTRLFDSVTQVFLSMVRVIMGGAPFFVFCLLGGVIAKMADSLQEVFNIFLILGMYSVTVLGGLLLMIFIVYPLVNLWIKPGMSYKGFFERISPALFLAFSTSSSAATLPMTMECVEKNMGISAKISNFVLPIGATVNMDGTSLYQGIAVVFLAQMHWIELSVAQQLIIVLTATLASIGAASVPSAGLFMMIIVLESVGLNPAWIAVIFPVDRLLDMFRTVVNVTGDITVAGFIARTESPAGDSGQASRTSEI